MGTGPNLEAGKIGGENHLLEITLSRDGTSYTGGKEKSIRLEEFVVSLVLPEDLIIVSSPSSSPTSSLFSSFLSSYQLQDTGKTGKAKTPGSLAGNPEEHLNPPRGIFLHKLL